MTTSKAANSDDTFKYQFVDYMRHAFSNKNSTGSVNDGQLQIFKQNFFGVARKYMEEDDGTDHPETPGVMLSLMQAIIGWHRDLDSKIANVDWTILGLLIVMISLVSIINMNLVSSLAVTGTQAIQSKSELTCLTQRIHLLVQYEEALTNRKHWFW